MIREPYNINPYNSTIDTSKVNNFGFTFSGDELGSWKVEIAKNNTSPDIVYTSKEFVPSDVGYEHIYDSDRVEGMTLPSTIAHNQEDDGLLRRLYDIVGYPYNASVVRLAVNDINDLGKIKGCTSDGYLVATTYSLGREDENVTILGYDENGVAVGSEVTNGTYNFLGYLLTVKANSDIAAGQKVQIGDNTFTIGDIEDTQDGYYELMIANGTGSFSGDAEVVTFDTLASANLTELKVKLTPAQDLHGYDAPWIGGGGINKLPTVASFTDSTLNGVTITKFTDGHFHISVGSSRSSSSLFEFTLAESVTVASGQYFMSVGSTETVASITFGLEESDGTKRFERYVGQGAYSISSSYTLTKIYIYVAQSLTNKEVDIYPMITDTNSITTFSPYSNICPIYPSNGKNLLPLNNGTYTVGSTVTLTINDGVISFDGTASSSGGRLVALTNNFTLKAGTYYIKTNRTNAQSTPVMYLNKVADNTAINGGDDRSFTLTEDTLVFGGINLDSGVNYTGATARPMLNAGTTTAPFAPYQGISVYQQGKNLFDVNDATGGGTGTTLTKGNGSIEIVNTNSYRYASIDFYRAGGIVASGKYPITQITFSFDVSGTLTTTWMAGLRYSSSNNFLTNERVAFSEEGHYSVTFDLSQITEPVYLSVSRTGNSTANIDVTFSNMQLELGLIATAYEPYNGTTYPIPLGRDVYGGIVDLATGKLTVTKVCVDLGSLTWTYNSTNTVFSAPTEGGLTNLGLNVMPDIICSQYPIITTRYGSNFPSAPDKSCTWSRDNSNVLVKDTDYTDKNTFTTAMSGVQVVYPLATPLEYDLTPRQIQTLIGTNNIWSSGNILNVTFSYEES